MEYILLIAWFALLIKWADYMVEWAWSIAKSYWVSNLVIGLTIIAFWTSAPELVTGAFSAAQWKSDLAISWILWSNISNLLLILWITAMIYPIKAPSNTFYKEIPFMLASTILFVLLVLFEPTQTITRPDALILIMFFGVFIYYIFRQLTRDKAENKILKEQEDVALKNKDLTKNKDWSNKNSDKENKNIDNNNNIRELPKTLAIVYTLWGLVGLVIWWKLIVDSAVMIAEQFGMPNSFIWVTIIAIWTSLPELAASVAAALKKNTDMAIWWIIWSNIFNGLWILWITWIISPLKAYDWINFDAFFNVFVVVLVSLLLFSRTWKFMISKKEWILLTSLYISYLGYLIYSLLP